MYGGLWEEENLILTGFINRDSLQQTLAFGTVPGSINISSILAASGDVSLRGIDDYIVAVADAANAIAARPAAASVGVNATALALDHKLQFILRAHSVCMPDVMPRCEGISVCAVWQGSLFKLLSISVELFLEEADSATHFTLICDITRYERMAAVMMVLSGGGGVVHTQRGVRVLALATLHFRCSPFGSQAHELRQAFRSVPIFVARAGV